MNYITQAIIYILELCLAISTLFILGNIISQSDMLSWTNNVVSFNFLEKALLLYGVYQIAIFVFLSLYDSARKDSILLKIRLIKLGILRTDYNQTFEEMDELYKQFTTSDLLINNVDKSDIEEIHNMYQRNLQGDIEKEFYIFYLKNKLILLEDRYEYYNLNWRLSLLLRLCK